MAEGIVLDYDTPEQHALARIKHTITECAYDLKNEFSGVDHDVGRAIAALDKLAEAVLCAERAILIPIAKKRLNT